MPIEGFLIQCDQCGCHAVKQRKTARFCSKKCKSKWHRENPSEDGEFEESNTEGGELGNKAPQPEPTYRYNQLDLFG